MGGLLGRLRAGAGRLAANIRGRFNRGAAPAGRGRSSGT
jgi:hypothetical protein